MQRIIAYIYRYKGEENIYRKCGNVGFCRVEEIDRKRVINICFKETHSITKDCEIKELHLDKKEDKNVCRCKIGKKLRDEKINGGQMRIKMQGTTEEGLVILCGEERYIVLWNGDKDAIIFQQEVREEVQEEIIEKSTQEPMIEPGLDASNETTKKMEMPTEYRCKIEEEQLFRAYNRLAKVPMIIDGSMHQVAKMKPQQMIMLPRKYWRLTNNPFLMESFYAHKHILFFKHKERYVIGVPSVMQENEKEYANKYGFTSTVTGYDYGRVNDEKTYWITYLN